jgi:1,4-alpha-glucan branching enzyme
MAHGAFTFVLHSHLPYVRRAGRWPHGEEWIHEAASETYIPLLQQFYQLRADGVPFKITIGITPVLAEQLDDPDVKDHFDQYLQDKIEVAAEDVERFEKLEKEQLHYLATFYFDYYTDIKRTFDETFGRDLIGAFRTLQDEGFIEITTSAATHGYLPLLGTDSAIRAQLRAGIHSYERMFGRKPTAIWLPECAYRPAYYDADGNIRPGIEYFLAEQGMKVFFSETHTITGGSPVGKAAGDAIGPYGEIKRRYLVPTGEAAPERTATTFRPYYVSDTTAGPDADQHSGVAVIGRNNRTGMQVWSAEWGYPGDYDYREFHRKDAESGLQYWRVSGPKVELGDKELYHPDWAEYKVQQHADHFARLVHKEVEAYHEGTGQFGLIASNYDTELFGHWWFEGVEWIGEVLRRLAEDDTVELTTASEYVEAHPPDEVLHLPEGSWGMGGTHFTWDNPETHWMWGPIRDAEERMEKLAADYDREDDRVFGMLKQAARELLLLESSDWPFLVTTAQAREYAIQRFSQHVERFEVLATSIENERLDGDLAAGYWELDNLFRDVDPDWWKARKEG